MKGNETKTDKYISLLEEIWQQRGKEKYLAVLGMAESKAIYFILLYDLFVCLLWGGGRSEPVGRE